jgi:large subunit ribosomal protein L23
MKDIYAVIKSMHVTEKGTRLTERENKYLFKVDPAANKVDIRRAVETLFKVRVVKVNVMNYVGKFRRERTAGYGQKSDWKRAIVTLKTGDKIALE